MIIAPVRQLAILALVLLVGCQQVARPNLAVPTTAPAAVLPSASEPNPTVVEPSPATVESTLETPVTDSNPVPPAPVLGRGADVFARISKSLNAPACAAGSNRWQQRYAGNPAMFANHLEQVLPLLDFVSIEVERAQLPTEFVFIPLVESWYKPAAIGHRGPAGMWQMIASTARNHGIRIQPGYDGRLSPVESTRAALSYLKTLQDMFGDWQAIVMAYNAGEGRLMRAFKRAQSRTVSAVKRKPHGMSNITYDYVAKLQALSCLIAQPEQYGLKLPLSTQFVPLAPVLMGAEVRALGQFAAAQGLDAGELRRLNPGYLGGQVVAGVPRLVLMPFGLPQAPVPTDTAPAVGGETAVSMPIQ